MDSKQCRVCGTIKPLSEYPNHKTGKDGHTNQCRACTSIEQRLYRETHHEQIKANNLKWRSEHKEYCRKSLNQWNADNREHVREKARESYNTNKEHRNEQRRKLYDLNRTANQEYRRNRYKMVYNVRLSNGLRRERYKQRGAGFKVSQVRDHWFFSLDYFNGCCAACGRPLNGLFHKPSLDHWIPVSKGGSNAFDNPVPMCSREFGCNNKKGNKDPLDWLHLEFGSMKAKKIAKRIETFFEAVRNRIKIDV